MKKLIVVSKNISKYGEAFLQFFETLVFEKRDLKEVNEELLKFLDLSPEESEKMTRDDEALHSNILLLLKYVKVLQIHGKIENTRTVFDLQFFENLSSIEIINCGKVHEIRNSKNISVVVCENSSVPLTAFPNLRHLHYVRTPINRINFSLISKNVMLDFACRNSKIIDVGKFWGQNWRSIKFWSFRSNKIVDIKKVINIPKVANLDLSFNKIKDISPLNSLRNLQVLDLTNNQISNMKLKLRRLRELRLSHNLLSKVDGILGCPNLKMIDISFNKLFSFDEINKLTRLGRLDELVIQGNRVVKENESDYMGIVRKFFDFRERFVIDGNEFVNRKEEEYDKIMKEITKTFGGKVMGDNNSKSKSRKGSMSTRKSILGLRKKKKDSESPSSPSSKGGKDQNYERILKEMKRKKED